MSFVCLRPYQSEDAEKILSWCSDEKAFYKWTAGVLGEYPLSAEAFNKVQGLTAFTALEDGEPVGFFTVRKPGESDDVLRFGFVIVDPQKRGKGYGKAMLQAGLKYAREARNAVKVTLGVFENNPSAYHCYHAVGFRDVILPKKETYEVLGQTWNCVEMEYDFQ